MNLYFIYNSATPIVFCAVLCVNQRFEKAKEYGQQVFVALSYFERYQIRMLL